MRPILIAQKMTEIDERFILGSVPPAAPAIVPSRLPLRDFFSHGWGVAIVASLVAVGVLAGIIAAGQREPVVPPVVTNEGTETDTEPDTDTEAITDTLPESETDTEPETGTVGIIDTPEEAAARRDELYALLDGLDFAWNITADPSYYFDQYEPIKGFGIYGVPYMLDYIMAHEGETDEQELVRLGCILHFAYHNLGITDVSDWYTVAGRRDEVFCCTEDLIEHLGDYGLTMPDSNAPSESDGEAVD